jgi:ubiquinone/menaquinone biosynthesis C-methylase UbiE
MSDEADRAQREAWSKAAGAWERRQTEMRESLAPLSAWMVDAIDPQPGETVLELAAGPGETGFIAARRLGDDGRLLSTDQSSEMVAVAQRRAAELGLGNVDFAEIDAQRLELEADSVDAVLCRFGYMLMGDPDAAFRGTCRVLRPGGRLAMATWSTPDRNLWMAAPAIQLVSRGALELPNPNAAGPFSMADADALCERLSAAGFESPRAEPLEFAQHYESFDDYWETTIDLAAPIAAALDALDDSGASEVRDAVHGALRQFESADGSLAIPASAVMTSARRG